MRKNLDTYAKNTWCPGCGNFSILSVTKEVLLEFAEKKKVPLENFVIVSGVGCHAKIYDYIDVNGFYSLHGRPIPAAEGIKLGNPNLKVIVFSGDGDCYGEGLAHAIFSAKRNIDITTIVHNNRVYGLTTGQFTPTSPLGFPGKSTPHGSIEVPFNPLELMLASGATYIARGYSSNIRLLKKLIKEAIMHKGFSLVDVLQVCKTFFDKHGCYDRHVYELKDHDFGDYQKASRKIIEWDYNSEGRIALGKFYQKRMPTFEYRFLDEKSFKSKNIDKKIKEKLNDFI